MFSRAPDLRALELRVGDIPWLIFDGTRGTSMAGMSDVPVTAEDTFAAVQELYPDVTHPDWAHFYSGGKRALAHPDHPVIIRMLHEAAGFNIFVLRRDSTPTEAIHEEKNRG